ncbi:MAG TPA: 2-amino-4-hydroxy-6-hydroxymethyldihydropteridine diphosphokinase [Piscirickettsiaceae bacterium]|jgi:2-amino-4-hydroxy-6-hydroxymethyldihydropteridine diphosphokinase|nr:2-amino-4-hydroxy-6-hydroxymethyldihydropteridine diphosphokinase [Piscirickettsiaceae bacterium]
MANIHINIGSNQNRRQNISAAIKALELAFTDLIISSVYQSPAEGFNGDDFYNVGVNAQTDLSVEDTADTLREIEQNQGRDRTQPKFSSRKIDLDLVLYDQVIDERVNLPRDDILKYAFVLAPLTELNAGLIHPVEQQSYQLLWQSFQSNNQYSLTQYNIDQVLK